MARLIEAARPTRLHLPGRRVRAGVRGRLRHDLPAGARAAARDRPAHAGQPPRVGPGHHGLQPTGRASSAAERPPTYDVSLAGWQLISLNSETDHTPGSAQIRWLRGRVAGPGLLPHRLLAPGPTTAPEPTATNPTSSRSGRPSSGAPCWCSTAMTTTCSACTRSAGSPSWCPGRAAAATTPSRPIGAWRSPTTSRCGALRLRLSPGVARYAFVSAAGRVLDSGVTRCRRT